MRRLPSPHTGRTIGRRVAGVFLALMLGGLGYTGAQACSTCGCTLNTDLGNQGVQGGTGWRLDLRYDVVDQSQLRQGGSAVSVTVPAPYEVEQRTRNGYFDLGLDYGFNRSWGVDLLLPLVGRFHSTFGVGDTRPSDSEYSSAVGDVRVLGRYTGFEPDMSSGILFGFKLPTGATDRSFDSGPDRGAPIDPPLQPGTGTTDAMLGAYHFGEFDGTAGWFAQAMYQHALDSHAGYKPGDSFNLNAGLRFYWLESVTPQLQFNYQVRARDSGQAADAPNSGGRVLYVSPGVSFVFDSGWHGFVFVQFPLHQYVNGLQLAPTRIISAGTSYAFH